MSWTTEREKQLTAMWYEGVSASDIAKTLGGVTRNAVVGKAHRLGLAGHHGSKKSFGSAPESSNRDTVPDAASSDESIRCERLELINSVVRARRTDREVAVHEDAKAPKSSKRQPRFINDDTHETCQWRGAGSSPSTEPCGQDVVPGKPYCKRHCALAYQPVPTQKPGGGNFYMPGSRSIQRY